LVTVYSYDELETILVIVSERTGDMIKYFTPDLGANTQYLKAAFSPNEASVWMLMFDYDDYSEEIICHYVLATNNQSCYTFTGSPASRYVRKGEGGDFVVYDDYIVLPRSTSTSFFSTVTSQSTYAYVIDAN